VSDQDGEVAPGRRRQPEARRAFDVVIEAGETEGRAAAVDEDVPIGQVLDALAYREHAMPRGDPGPVVMVAGHGEDADGRLASAEGIEDGVEAFFVLGQVPGDRDEVRAGAIEHGHRAPNEPGLAPGLQVQVAEDPDPEPLESGRQRPDMYAFSPELEPARLDDGCVGGERRPRPGGGRDPVDGSHGVEGGASGGPWVGSHPLDGRCGKGSTTPMRSCVGWYATSLAVALWVASPAAGQDPPAEAGPEAGEEEAAEEPDRWSAEVGLSLNASGGNESLTVLTTELGLTHLERTVYELSVRGRVRYGQSDGAEVARNVRGTIDGELRPGEAWSPFLIVTGEHDPFRRLDARLTGGIGVKRTFWRQGWSDVSLSTALLYEYERVAVDLAPADITHRARWSWRGRTRHQVREGTRLEQVIFFQPAWNRIEDYLIEARTSGRVALTEALAVTTSLLYQRDSTPPPDVAPDDWSLTVGLSVATGW
jgi:hypothetical protein